jgi:CMP-N-acetylneuraminic acid synthetase
MKVHGVICVSARDCGGEFGWATPFDGGTLLSRAVATLRATPNVDEVFIVTDEPELLARAAEQSAPVRGLPGWFFDFKLPFFSKEHWLLTRALSALNEAGVGADVLLALDWRAPLVSSRTLERMYHRLLEDRVAARITGMYPVDPNLFMILPDSGAFFPVWSDPGADRQSIPQLYRTLDIGALHPARLLMPIPETKGLRIPREEGLVIERAEHLDLAAFYLARRAGQTPAGTGDK